MKWLPLLSVVLLSGCLPEERFWWSPLGDCALVALDDGLHLADAEGRLGEVLVQDLVPNDNWDHPVSWLPDGTGFVVHRTRIVPTWAEVGGLLREQEVEQVEAMVPAVLPLLEAAAKVGGEDALEKACDSLTLTQMMRFLAAVQQVHEREPEQVKAALLALPEGAEMLASLEEPGSGYEINELVLFALVDGQVSETRSLACGLLTEVEMPQVSPGQEALAFVRRDRDQEVQGTLEVVALGGGDSQAAAHSIPRAFDWTVDGRGLVFFAPLSDGGGELQGIHRRTVLTEEGDLIAEESMGGGEDSLVDPVTMATVIALPVPRLQVLADGRVLFASQPATLPSVGTFETLAPQLFLISADGQAVTAVPTVPGDLPANLCFFTASPDGRRVAVVESETDAVAVVEIDTGRTEIISPGHPHWKCRTLPAWKSATELTYAALGEEAPSWQKWSPGEGTLSLSEGWPAERTAEWLKIQKDAEEGGTEE